MRRVICSILHVGTVWRNWRYFFLQLSSRTQFVKIKKLSPKINVKTFKNRVTTKIKVNASYESVSSNCMTVYQNMER